MLTERQDPEAARSIIAAWDREGGRDPYLHAFLPSIVAIDLVLVTWIVIGTLSDLRFIAIFGAAVLAISLLFSARTYLRSRKIARAIAATRLLHKQTA